MVLGKVAEMKVEYFAPKEDIVLFNDSPSELYILVTGSAVKYFLSLILCLPKIELWYVPLPNAKLPF
jgi:hypothetical protein